MCLFGGKSSGQNWPPSAYRSYYSSNGTIWATDLREHFFRSWASAGPYLTSHSGNMLHYWIDWLTKSKRNRHIWRRKKSFFMMPMHHLKHRTLDKQKSMNCVANRFRIHRILQTWPPATIICSQTWRDDCVVGVLSRTNKLNGKQKGILEGWTNFIIWKA